MQMSIEKLKRDGLLHIVYYVVLYVALIATAINLCVIEGLNCYIRFVTVIILLVTVIRFIIFFKRNAFYYKKKVSLQSNGSRVKAVVDENEFYVSSDRIMQVCEITAYYTHLGKTYVFKDDIWYFGQAVSDVLMQLKKEGDLPGHIEVLVDNQDCNKYVVLKHEYLCNAINMSNDF